MVFFHIDVDPKKEDFRYLVQKKVQELAGGAITPFCSFCRMPTVSLITWMPKETSRAAIKAPPGKDRIFFFPVCAFCSTRDHAEEELQWKTVEFLHTNVPLEAGHNFHH